VSEIAARDRVSDDLRSRLDAAVGLRPLERLTESVKAALQEALRTGALDLPARFRQPRPDTYARRLFHRDPEGRYTVVAMTWGPRQGTPLHDHAGIWCVECVVDGNMEVAQYDLVSEDQAGTYHFVERNRIQAGRGSAGCLIPPFEYHTLANVNDSASITLHVYGGEMDHCHVFEPDQAAGSWRRVRKTLSYHE
jgi:predicted metal-dependent enzyme (double-stranded beta helix superfamily)